MAIIPTPEQVEYMQAHIRDTEAPIIHISNGILIGAALISLSLRCIARSQSPGGFGNDDYAIFVAVFLYLVFAVAFSVATRYGVGAHIVAVTDLRAFTIVELFLFSSYVLGMVGVKCSIILLYRRIFPSRQVGKALLGISGVLMAWFFAALFCSIFNCYPISKAWKPSVSGFCLDYGVVTLVIGIANILLDFTLLGLPMPLLWNLHVSTRRKVLLMFMFALGCSACIVSIVRLAFARQVASTYDPSWDNVIPGVLSGLEICTGIVACCAVTYRPLLERILGRSMGSQDRSFTGKSDRSGTSNKQGWNKITGHGYELSHLSQEDRRADLPVN